MFVELIIFAFAIILVILSCTNARQRTNTENNEPVNASLQEVRQTMSQRRLAQQDQPPPSAPTPEELEEARQEREQLVNDSLFSKKLEEGDSTSSIKNIMAVAQGRYELKKDGNAIGRSWRSVASSVRTLSKPECSICLDTYKTGETICWAKTDECDHIFHQECISEWMKNHDNCPLCRTILIVEQGSA